jgi:hypothetical protein
MDRPQAPGIIAEDASERLRPFRMGANVLGLLKIFNTSTEIAQP